MNAQIKKLWVDALRSGEYEQVGGALQENGRFCCLGVLCDLAVKNGVPVEVTESPSTKGKFYYDGIPGTLPVRVRDWSGVSTPLGTLPPRRGVPYPSLAQANDNHEPFTQIANYIERYF